MLVAHARGQSLFSGDEPVLALHQQVDQHLVHGVPQESQQYRNTLDGSVDEVEASYRYDFTFPFSSMLTIAYPDGEIECIQLSAMPESADSSLVFQQSARTNQGGDPLESWRDFQAAVNEEDRVICEALRPREVPFGLDETGEVALPTDAFSIACRRLWKSRCST